MNIYIKLKLDELLSKKYLKNNEIIEFLSELKSNNMTFNDIIDIKYLKENNNRFDFEDEEFDGELKNDDIESFIEKFYKFLSPIDDKTIKLYNNKSQTILYEFNIKKLNELIIDNINLYKNTIQQILNKYEIKNVKLKDLFLNKEFKIDDASKIEMEHLSNDIIIDIQNLINELKNDFNSSQTNLENSIKNNRLLNSKVGIDIPTFNY